MVRFEDLNDDILYLILDLFRYERVSILHHLRLVSKRLNVFADSIVNWTVTLDDNDLREQASYRFIERLLDPLDVLRSHVRNLRVAHFKGDKDSSCMNINLLVACLQSIRKLDSLRSEISLTSILGEGSNWETKIPFPDDMLHAMQQHHPTAQLSIYSTDLNQAVVLSSQLRRLDVSIPCSDDFRPASVAPFEQLRRLLVQNSNVRALSIKIHHDPALRERAEREEMEGLSQLTPNSMPGLDVVPHGPTIESNTIVATDVANKIQIPLNSTDRLPPLELLSIESERYNLDLEHIGCLYICMDWTKLKRLKLGPSNPVAFFETFTGQAPLLEHLDISFHSNPSLTACSTFVASLNMLRELVIRCDLISQTRTFWPVLARTHGDVLEHLTLRSRYEGVEAHIWTRPVWENSLGSFIRNFTSLRSLDITLRLDDGAQTRCRHCSHPLNTGYVEVIPYIPSLQTLRITVRLQSHIESSIHRYITDHAHCAIRKLWAFYVDTPVVDKLPHSNLGFFSIQYWQWENPSAHAKQNGTARVAHIKRVVFDSMRQGRPLVVKDRYNGKVLKTYYGNVVIEKEDQQTFFVPEEQHASGQPFITPDHSQEASGNMF